MPIHAGISGYSGAGKTTVSRLLAARAAAKGKKVVWRGRITTQPPREGAIPGHEYDHPEHEEFVTRAARGEILFIHPVMQNKKPYMTGILRPEAWAPLDDEVDLVLYLLGRAAPKIKREYIPEMTTILLKVEKEPLIKRMITRSDESIIGFHERWANNEWYEEIGIDGDYDHIVHNNGTPLECAIEIEKILGL